MKVISKEEEQAHYSEVLKGGFMGGSVGLGLGLAGVLAASRRYAAFRSLTLPFRTFLVSSAATFGAITTAERYSISFQKAKDPMNFYKDETQRILESAKQSGGDKQKFMDWGRENRYSIVFASWIAAMAIALTIVGRDKYLSTSQKLVQARVYAQGLTLAVLIATAAFETSDAKAGKGRWETIMVVDPNDPKHEHLIEKKIHKEEYEGQDLWKGEFLLQSPVETLHDCHADEMRLQKTWSLLKSADCSRRRKRLAPGRKSRPPSLHPRALPTEAEYGSRLLRRQAVRRKIKQWLHTNVKRWVAKRGVRCIGGVVFITVQYYDSMYGVSERDMNGILGRKVRHQHITVWDTRQTMNTRLIKSGRVIYRQCIPNEPFSERK